MFLLAGYSERVLVRAREPGDGNGFAYCRAGKYSRIRALF